VKRGFVRALCVVCAIVALIDALPMLAEEAAGAECVIQIEPDASLRTAVEEAPEGAVICLAPGTYRGPVVLSKNVTIRGIGPSADEVILVSSSRDGTVQIPVWPRESWVIGLERLTIVAEGEAIAAVVVEPAIAGTVIIHECRIEGSHYGLAADASALVQVRNSVLSGEECGLCSSGKSHVTMDGCQVERSEIGVAVRILGHVTMEDCEILDCHRGVEAGLEADLHMRRSRILRATDWTGFWVGDDATAAVEDSQITDCLGNGLVVGDRASAVVTGTTITRSGGDGLGVWGDSSATVDGCTISATGGVGLAADTTGNVEVSNTSVTGSAGWTGIAVSGPTGTLVKPLTLVSCAAANNAGNGLHIGDSAVVEISGGRFSANGGVGIAVTDTARATITGAEISGNRGWSGAVVADRAETRMMDCDIDGNVGNGLAVVHAAAATVERCSISRNGDNGVAVGTWPSGAANLIENTIHSNGCWGVVHWDYEKAPRQLTGSGNVIPDRTSDANGCGAVDPEALRFLMSD